jgi:hypothetical protein
MTIETHAITRTSPKGQPFLGTCFRCGRENLPAKAVQEPCENLANLSADEVLIMAVGGILDDD